ncbi:MAG: PIN domain-containing protein [Nitrospinae bacterium]|nr:PIN domain-containing protein [Nitrospinota bacterium]
MLVDTSAWYALFDEDDKHHERANIFYDHNLSPFVTINFIIDETLTLVKKRLGHRQAVEAGKDLCNKELSSLVTITAEDEATAWRIFQRYDDKGFSFTDCTTFAVMERLKIPSVFTFDDHFKQYGKFKCLT